MLEKLYQNAPAEPGSRLRIHDNWPVLVLAAGLVLTLAWSGFLLWALSTVIRWLIL